MAHHFTGIHDFDLGQLQEVLTLAHAVKARPDVYRQRLAGRTMAMIFEKSSTRTRVSFEVGMFQLGGHAVFLSNDDSQIGRGETPADTARVLSRYVDLIMARTYTHATLLELAEHSQVPVINALTEQLHPCQGLADGMTLQERFGDRLAGRKAAWIGDGNNVAHSFIMVCMGLGVSVSVASPNDYQIDSEIVERARSLGAATGAGLELTEDPAAAAADACAVSTDVWASMGQEQETEQRLQDFAGFQVDAALMEKAAPDAVFLHCLPCHRGEEVAAEVVDGSRSAVLDQAENRLHVQKAVMLTLSGRA